MAIEIFPNTAAGLAAAQAVAAPRHLWQDGPRIRVFTGADYDALNLTLPPESITVSMWAFFEAMRLANDYAAAETHINTLSVQRQNFWKRATHINRSQAVSNNLRAGLSKSAAYWNNVFVVASGLDQESL